MNCNCSLLHMKAWNAVIGRLKFWHRLYRWQTGSGADRAHDVSHVSSRFKMIFFWVPLRLFMFVRIVCVANSPEKVSLCLADLNLSRILNQCQLLSKGHEQNFARKRDYWTSIQEMWTWFYVLASVRMTTCQRPGYSRLQLEVTCQMWMITFVSQKEIIYLFNKYSLKCY